MTNTEKWQDFVNDFIFANYKNVELCIVKRGVSENGMLLNYIQFPKAENGSQLSRGYVKFILLSIEEDEKLCELIFGPGYDKGTADIQDDELDITIIWNLNYYDDVDNETYFNSLYNWKI